MRECIVLLCAIAVYVLLNPEEYNLNFKNMIPLKKVKLTKLEPKKARVQSRNQEPVNDPKLETKNTKQK